MSAQQSLVNASVTWTGTSGHTYGLYKLNKSWSEANSYAISVGGYLVKVDSSTENDEIFQKLSASLTASELGKTSASDGGGSAYVWLGGTNLNIPGKWVWSIDGSLFSSGYTNWGKGALGSEPDNFGGTQNSLALGMQSWPNGFSINSGYGNAGQWNDISGTNALYFLVEVNATSSSVSLVQNTPYQVTTSNLSIIGSSGRDTVSYLASSASFVINVVGVNTTVSDKTGALGNGTLTNIERLQFSDKNIALDLAPTQAAGQTALLIGAVLPGQLVYDVSKQALLGSVVGLFDQGFTLAQLSGAILRLPIWDVLTGKAAPTNADIAGYLVNNVYGGTQTAAITNAAIAAMSAETPTTQGTYLASLAAGDANQAHINLVGVQATGLTYMG